jgi:hypothetical protein
MENERNDLDNLDQQPVNEDLTAGPVDTAQAGSGDPQPLTTDTPDSMEDTDAPGVPQVPSPTPYGLKDVPQADKVPETESSAPQSQDVVINGDRYVIRHKENREQFWNEDTGFGTREAATEYTEEQAQETLPDDREWKRIFVAEPSA